MATQAASLAEVGPADPSSQPAVIPLSQATFPPTLDNWEVDEQLRHIGRVLAVEDLEAARPDILRVDAAHPRGVAKTHRVPQRTKRSGLRAQEAPGQGLLPYLAWFCTLLGTMATTCGAVLLGWSAWTERQELWRIGVPITLGGLVVLAVGVLLQLDQSWQHRRAIARPRPKGMSAASS